MLATMQHTLPVSGYLLHCKPCSDLLHKEVATANTGPSGYLLHCKPCSDGTYIGYIAKTSGRWSTGKTKYKSDRVQLLQRMDGYKCQ